MDRAEIIQLADKLVRAMPHNRDMETLRDAIRECFAIASSPTGIPFDKKAYMRSYMRAYRIKRRAVSHNPFA